MKPIQITPLRPIPPYRRRAEEYELAPAPILLQLARQPVDIIDHCLSHLPPEDRAQLAHAIPQRRLLREPASAPFIERLAASNHQSVASGVAAGALHDILLAGLDGLRQKPPQSGHWAHINARRLGVLQILDAVRTRLSIQVPEAQAQKFFNGFAVAIAALDCLNDAANPAARRRAGRDALLMASHMDGPMQDTLMGHVVVGVALAYMGRVEAAEALFSRCAHRDLSAVVQPRADKALHLQQLMADLPSFPDRCLLWVKAAAWATGSEAIAKVFARMSLQVGPIDDKYIDPAGLNLRWPTLREGRYAEHQWAQAHR